MATVQTWIQKIGDKLGIAILYSERLYRVLVNQASHIRKKVRQCSGSIPKPKFLKITWEFQLHSDEVEVAALGDKIKALEAEVSALRDQHSDIQREVEKLESDESSLQDSKYRLKKSTTPLQGRGRSAIQFEDYSDSHKRRLKRT